MNFKKIGATLVASALALTASGIMASAAEAATPVATFDAATIVTKGGSGQNIDGKRAITAGDTGHQLWGAETDLLDASGPKTFTVAVKLTVSRTGNEADDAVVLAVDGKARSFDAAGTALAGDNGDSTVEYTAAQIKALIAEAGAGQPITVYQKIAPAYYNSAAESAQIKIENRLKGGAGDATTGFQFIVEQIDVFNVDVAPVSSDPSSS
ncbi:MAG: hypothetical protein K0R90_525, partial [Oscillospiraceae bacterium]|nr:hypothetical protein [Oscillospiraceae bacterium]